MYIFLIKTEKSIVSNYLIHIAGGSVKIRPFSSAKTSCMEYYIAPTKRDLDPGIYILHVGTNDLTLDDTPEEITEHIVNIAASLKTENNTVVISNIVPRGDSKKRKGGSI